MDEGQVHHRSHLFTLRIWSEALGGGRAEWRGKVQHVYSGEARYFRDWPTLVTFLLEMLPGLGGEESTTKSDETL
jgi:hypothetical protein